MEKEISGGAAETTNNRMELTGVIEALSLLKEPCVVELYSDSKYVIDALSKGWVYGWQKRGWVKSDKKPCLERGPLGAAAPSLSPGMRSGITGSRVTPPTPKIIVATSWLWPRAVNIEKLFTICSPGIYCFAIFTK